MKKHLLSLLILMLLSACSARNAPQSTAKPIMSESPFIMTASSDGAEEFVKLNADYVSMYDNDTPYNITPVFVRDHSDFRIFKYDQSCESFLLLGGKAVRIAGGFGGYGLTSLALADISGGGAYSLFYTFSLGSGIHRSQAGYFDADGNTEHIFDFSLIDNDMLLAVNESGELTLMSAEVEFASFVDMKLTAVEEIGRISLESGKPELILNDGFK